VGRHTPVAATRSEVAGDLTDCTRLLADDVEDESGLRAAVAEEGDA
jgi:hypothetical protein